ncbi:MAG TPA: rhodanese-like domain-containing protein [Actinomycetes bacterium]|nr:rhodanese-like domain-containing protein [Actinomycetes bacterium]
MDVRIVETPDLGDRSYVVGAGDVVVVVDPQRDVDRVEALLAGRRLTHVLETHVHNDYLSGGLDLARRHGATYVVPAGVEVGYDREPMADGDRFDTGSMHWEAVATPGHTQHHLSYAVRVGDETAAFTGGSLLFGSVGRTDLVEDDLTEQLTRDQWHSVRRLVDRLPAGAAVLPTHGFGSFCSASATSGDASTIAEQQRTNSAFQQDEDAFVAELVAGLDAYPAYYAHMGPANLAGPEPIDLTPPSLASADELRKRLASGEWVVDLRARAAFAEGFLPGTLSFDSDGNVVTYLGWLLPWGTPVTLLGDTAEQVAAVQRDLARIGIDRPAARAVGGPAVWARGSDLATYPRTDFGGLAHALREDPGLTVLDVRSASEHRESRVRGAVHVPLHLLAERMDDLPGTRLWVHCGSGFRAAVAASLLAAHGHDVVHVDEDFESADAAGLPLESGPA